MTPKPAKAHDRRVLHLTLMAGLPGVVVSMVLLWFGDHSTRVQWTFSTLVLGLWWILSFNVKEVVVRPLQTISNLLSALREEDFSFRARRTRRDDPLSEVLTEVNALATTLREQRLGALEATALLRKVMEEIDVVVFAFDGHQRLRLVNRAGERMLGRAAEQLLGRTAAELGLSAALEEQTAGVLDLSFQGGGGRWETRRGTFRQGGLPHQLLVLTNVSRALREEERQAWQRLIRVIGHEMNNSLAPIKSIAGSLVRLVKLQERPPDLDEDISRGLGVISARSEALSRFMEAYSRLARLPPPKLAPVHVAALARRIAGLETRVPVTITGGPDVVVQADADQLEQLLINLLHNAADASDETGGGVNLGWEVRTRDLVLWVEDEGPGLSATANLFVPFFTTKPLGSGIGLVLSRQIAEAHGGTLDLTNRTDREGCRANLTLPAQ